MLLCFYAFSDHWKVRSWSVLGHSSPRFSGILCATMSNESCSKSLCDENLPAQRWVCGCRGPFLLSSLKSTKGVIELPGQSSQMGPRVHSAQKCTFTSATLTPRVAALASTLAGFSVCTQVLSVKKGGEQKATNRTLLGSARQCTRWAHCCQQGEYLCWIRACRHFGPPASKWHGPFKINSLCKIERIVSSRSFPDMWGSWSTCLLTVFCIDY